MFHESMSVFLGQNSMQPCTVLLLPFWWNKLNLVRYELDLELHGSTILPLLLLWINSIHANIYSRNDSYNSMSHSGVHNDFTFYLPQKKKIYKVFVQFLFSLNSLLELKIQFLGVYLLVTDEPLFKEVLLWNISWANWNSQIFFANLWNIMPK